MLDAVSLMQLSLPDGRGFNGKMNLVTSTIEVVGTLSGVNSFLASLLIKLVLPTLQSPIRITL